MREGPVIYVTRMVPSYRTDALERLNERLDGRLIVAAGAPSGSSSLNYLMDGSDRGFHQIPLRNYWFFGGRLHAQPFWRALRRLPPPNVVIAEESPRTVTLPLLIRYAKREAAGVVLWGHFSSLRRSFAPGRHLQDRYRVTLARRADACIGYTRGVVDLLRPYVDEERLFVARNTIHLEPLLTQRAKLAEEGKSNVRRRLGLAEEAAVLIYMGRLIREKGIDSLIRTHSLLRAHRNAELLIIGDGPERAAMKTLAEKESFGNVRFLGPLDDESAGEYLFAADVMVMPGYLGLVINHSFAYGLPVVSFRDPHGASSHSPEVEYVESGQNGLLVTGSTIEDLASGIISVLNDLSRYSQNALRTARDDLTIDVMVDGLVHAVRFAENEVSRRHPHLP